MVYQFSLSLSLSHKLSQMLPSFLPRGTWGGWWRREGQRGMVRDQKCGWACFKCSLTQSQPPASTAVTLAGNRTFAGFAGRFALGSAAGIHSRTESFIPKGDEEFVGKCGKMMPLEKALGVMLKNFWRAEISCFVIYCWSSFFLHSRHTRGA